MHCKPRQRSSRCDVSLRQLSREIVQIRCFGLAESIKECVLSRSPAIKKMKNIVRADRQGQSKGFDRMKKSVLMAAGDVATALFGAPAASRAAMLVANIDVSSQTMTVRYGLEVYRWTVSTARPAISRRAALPAAAHGADVVFAKIPYVADALFRVLPWRLCHPWHWRRQATRTPGLAWLRAAAHGQCRGLLFDGAGSGFRQYAHRSDELGSYWYADAGPIGWRGTRVLAGCLLQVVWDRSRLRPLFAPPVADLPPLVEPHPLAGILAHPAFDHVVQHLGGGGTSTLPSAVRGKASLSSISSRKRLPGSLMQRAG